MGLLAAEKVFGCDVNSKGFKIPRGCSVIQGELAAWFAAPCQRLLPLTGALPHAGDGIDCGTMEDILAAVHAAGFSAQSVGFGMGGGLLQKVCCFPERRRPGVLSP